MGALTVGTGISGEYCSILILEPWEVSKSSSTSGSYYIDNTWV